MNKKILAATLLCLIICLPSIVSATLFDDRYHFSDYQENPNVADYGEWWYFNFNQDNIQAVIQYSLWDPAQTSDTSFGLMYISISYEGETLDMFFPVPWTDPLGNEIIFPSENSANLVMGPNTITVSDESYALQGYVFDLQGNTVSWDLQYEQTSQSLEIETINMSSDPNEEMNWYLHMPSAAVSGVIIFNGNEIAIDAAGYHDHNWGPWKLYNGLWNWFQTNSQDFALVGYDFFTLGCGSIKVVLDKEKITFDYGTYTIINLDWELYPPPVGQLYPTKTLVLANSKGCSLILYIEIQQTGFVQRYYEYEGLLWTVFESTASFTGVLRGRAQPKVIESGGFAEYTTSISISTP